MAQTTQTQTEINRIKSFPSLLSRSHSFIVTLTKDCDSVPGRRGVTLGKPDIKVETVNKETHSLEEEASNVSTATRMVKAMYSVSRHPSESPGAAERGGVWVNDLT